MSGSFAGARTLDERRRRRLAAGADEPCADPVPPPRFGPWRPNGAGGKPEEQAAWHFPLAKLISRRAWKHWTAALLGLLLAAAVLSAGWYAPQWEPRLGPGFSRLFDLSAGRAVRGYSLLLLTLSAQLALLVWWVRSRSPNDYTGRYRVWLWAAAGVFVLAAGTASDAHRAFGETLIWLTQLQLGRNAAMAWLLPAIVFGTALLRALDVETCECRTSRTLLWLAGLAGLAAGGMQLDLPLAVSPAERALVTSGCVLAAQLFLCLGLSLHARHVIYFTADPPEFRPSWLWSVMRSIRLPKLQIRLGWARPRPNAPADGAAGEGAAASSDENAETETATTTRRRSTKSAGSRKTSTRRSSSSKSRPSSRTAAEEPEEEETAEPEIEETAAAEPAIAPAPARKQPAAAGPVEAPPPAARQPSAAQPRNEPAPPRVEAAPEPEEDDAGDDPTGQTWRFDGPEKDALKGLSKRERRKLQKQWREQQKAGRR